MTAKFFTTALKLEKFIVLFSRFVISASYLFFVFVLPLKTQELSAVPFDIQSPNVAPFPDNLDSEINFGESDLRINFFVSSYQKRLNHALIPPKSDVHVPAYDFGISWHWNQDYELTDQIKLIGRFAGFSKQIEKQSDLSQTYALEAYAQMTLSHVLSLDLGKINHETGHGYYRTPSSLLTPRHTPPFTEHENIQELEGLLTARGSAQFDRWKILTIIAEQIEEKEAEIKKNQYQASLELGFEFDFFDLNFIGQQASGDPANYAFFGSALLNDELVVYAEVSIEKQRKKMTPVSPGSALAGVPRFYSYQTADEKNYLSFVLGGQYTFFNQSNLIFEYYRNGKGYSKTEWEKIKDGIDFSQKNIAFHPAYSGFLLQTLSGLGNRDLRQNYAFLRWSSLEPSGSDYQWEQVLVYNLDDQSQIHQSKLNAVWNSNETLTSSFIVNLSNGAAQSEFGLTPIRFSLILETEYVF